MSDKKVEKLSEEEVNEGRRELIRKAAYTAPALTVLGLAAHSINDAAAFSGPPDPPTQGASPEDDQLLEDLEQAEKEKSGG